VTGLPEGWLLQSVRFDGRDITDLATDLAARSPAPPLEITLTNRVARPVVRVTDDRGEPVTAYTVLVIAADESRQRLARSMIDKRADDTGVTKLGPLRPGR